MSRHVFRLPDLGEGTVSAEIVAWRVQPGEAVAEDQPLVEMSTDKAVVEVPAPVAGRLVSVAGQPGDAVAVGAELAVFEIETEGETATGSAAVAAAGTATRGGRIMASPATRRRAKQAGIDLARVAGSGPGGRIVGADLAAVMAAAAAAGAAPGASTAAAGIEEVPLIGIRRVIAQRMAEAKREAPHFAYVEEVDVTALESLRRHLNARLRPGEAPYTYLPFVVAALVPVLAQHPQCNARHDAARNLLLRHRAVHAGIATQTPDGLKVPVVRDAGRLGLRALAAEIRRVTAAAREGHARRDELSGSTITITSLGKLGGIVSTPILNLPEVAIVGLNRAIERPVVLDGQVVVRRMMNLSSSFDHRFVDGHDAAAMIQALKERLEQPATLFID
ncbi:MAG: 2-oxo acid dehydrogenase subunit E2 [Steroidobacteraceae bacterium]|nr:2-oxo acid dehydrogenase subunit E2 [Steroidobacteraceae bacterium]